MSTEESHFEIPGNIESYIATLEKLYEREGQTRKQKILVNASVTVDEGWSGQDWNGVYGHAVYLRLPVDMFVDLVRDKVTLQDEIKLDLNKIHNVREEFIEKVFLETDVAADSDWRRESGLLLDQRQVTANIGDRIWTTAHYRLFLSHRAEAKRDAASLKDGLKLFGVSAFVAHDDILPTKEWVEEILGALSSMDALVALITEEFHYSAWTDQELGYALARGVPIITVNRGQTPCGFVARFQALSCSLEDAPLEIIKLLVGNSHMTDAYVTAVGRCPNWAIGNILAQVLPSIKRLTKEQIQGLLAAWNENGQVRGSFGFNGLKPTLYGVGLAAHLSRVTGREYMVSELKII